MHLEVKKKTIITIEHPFEDKDDDFSSEWNEKTKIKDEQYEKFMQSV